MQGKGLQLVPESQNPDLILTASGGLRQQTSYQAWGMRGIGGGMGGITPEQNVIGTMIVDLYDAKTKTLIWRGIAQDTLSTNGNKNSQIGIEGGSEDVQTMAGRITVIQGEATYCSMSTGRSTSRNMPVRCPSRALIL